MEDRFKFRVWDLDKNVVIQFCTGLKDKNGKLIYEGDILSTTYKETEVYQVKFGIYQDNEQYRDGEHLSFFCEDIKDPQLTRTLPDVVKNNKSEIIGNFYENPELLKRK